MNREKNSVPYANDGGLYKNINVTPRVLGWVIVIGMGVLIALVVLGAGSGGLVVRYNSRGGSDVASQTYSYLEALQLPESPKREGYRFEGWALDDSCQVLLSEGMAVEQDMEVYACWAPS